MLDRVNNRREDELRASEEGRLPPGQSLTVKFPVLHYGPVPKIDLAEWNFRVWGDVDEEVVWDWKEFLDLPRKKLEMDIHCVTRWSKFGTSWDGVSVKALIDSGMIKPKSSALFVMQHAEYGFTTNLPIEVVLADNFLLATHFNEEPITPDHGYPLRGVVGQLPGRKDITVPYFWKGAKWLRGLEFMAQDRPGFWEQAGYHNKADVWEEQRFE